jgi:GDP-L-fucose synthase
MARTPFELKGKTVFVAGHGGMVGVRRLAQENVELLTVKPSDVDLRDQAAVFGWFAKARPQVVFLAAAKVGGIVANNTLRAEFIYDNLIIATNVIHAAHTNGAEKADVSRLVVHLSQARAAAAARGFHADGTA